MNGGPIIYLSSGHFRCFQELNFHDEYLPWNIDYHGNAKLFIVRTLEDILWKTCINLFSPEGSFVLIQFITLHKMSGFNNSS